MRIAEFPEPRLDGDSAEVGRDGHASARQAGPYPAIAIA